MTSCDDNLAKYILPQLVAIDKNLHEYDVHFFLAHSRIFPKNIQMLKNFANERTSITFHETKVTKNISFYESLVSNGGMWPREAYFTLRVQDHIPNDVDRIMYIDAGDVIINGDIAPYYFGDFEGKSIIATPYIGFKENPVTKELELHTKDDMLKVAKSDSLFNSGCYVINVDKFRKEGYTLDDYTRLCGILVANTQLGEYSYFGDQGFLSAAFCGDIKFFGYPKHKDPSYMPYNFTSFYWHQFIERSDYKPVVLHYATMVKPWGLRFSDEVINMVFDKPDFMAKHPVAAKDAATIPITCLHPKTLRLNEIWWKYANETQIYDEANTRARITAESWMKHYLPLCAQHIEVCHNGGIYDE